MLKKLISTSFILLLIGCSNKAVIDLPDSQRDAKSYAIAYQTTVQSFQGIVGENYEVDDFTRGAQAWYRGDIKTSIANIRDQLYNQLQDSDLYAFRSGVVFAGELQNNFSRLNQNCWSLLNKPSLTQGIYDAMRDLRRDRVREENDPYLTAGTEQFLQNCRK
ncbi:hypothetical protein FHQ26_07180 [Testudinibacter sp. TR-2022]|uniref:hypothetical protein n=1 Tax=Testudinibacter sp. TR-2022 TaxID=2585029 RepID=UPI00111A3E7E|nr:hypothetical protein [Testudinibacter sp. TR-2022]TNH04586.1 hypothetical protein FHQ22_03910 [Pasteurellaceae bacterium Phil31]TNH09400.1 hypothetical protein FHQ26_07180 [Testudinibacter sp. TR-2022]TNH09813.1 hypothetical protein FHQ25_07130 [Testudinibacter sp. TR-2022]TNH13858.1 hypothetical protein FIA56_06150 [Testudinibacter sp. TR-2022]TNH20673.1 hypothetical protein FHQ23_00875 [Testudinibacter sp. TR-2022]